MVDINFYRNKRVLVTGHTGFKGAWLCYILSYLGANVTGYALKPPTDPNLFTICNLDKKISSIIGDIRDHDKLQEVFYHFNPEIVIHMAAQPIVRESYKNPHYTYEVNLMGTVNTLDCVRNTNNVKSFLNVTTDKVYYNYEWERGYIEADTLGGFDPYSSSKSCSELVTQSYINSFFNDSNIAVSTARSGNVIAGGDFAAHRIIPDCVKAAINSEIIMLRNPNSTRPYQHVLETLFAYLMIAQKQYEDKKYASCYNIGPDDCDCISTGELTDLFCKAWGDSLRWESKHEDNLHEAGLLKLDCSKLKAVFGWKPKWHIDKTVDMIVEWTKAYYSNESVSDVMDKQIDDFLYGM
ncbi:MAG: CDP-glucose 4,6-dehydratase [Oscillospiraceae bacterium]|jgi:CDP-glucose 4,6-dehydratase|nr:CDP-glucose 4,6-dehydratase [Oscillospiraceae bacterium]